MSDAVRRLGLSRALKWTGLSALLLLTAGAALHYAMTSPAPAAEPTPAAEATPAARALPAEQAATKSRTPRPPSDEDSEAPEADEEADAWLGVVLAGGDDDGDDESEGVRVLSVAGGSPAEEAGLRRNDRIVRMETREIGSYDDIARFMNRQQPGDSVTIVVMRGGSKKTLHATLAEEPRSRRRHVQIYRDDDDDDDEESFRFEMPGVPEPPEPPEPPDAPRRAPGHPGAWAFRTGSRPMLGVSVHPMSEDLRSYFKVPEDAGILVDSVIEGSAAAKAGLKAGDVIVAVDGKSIADAGDIGEALSEHESGDEVEVRVVRDGSERTFQVSIQKSSGKGRRGSFYFRGPEGFEGLKGLKGFEGGDWTWKRKDGEALPPEVKEEIKRSMRQAHEQVREAMERVHRELREQKIHLRQRQQDGEKQQRMIERQLRDELRRLRDRDQGVIHTGQTVSYDL